MGTSKIKIHYIKNAQFRSFYATGAFGGVAPTGLINLAFYVERPAIPLSIVHELNQEGSLAGELRDEREGKEGIVREVDCNIMIDLNTAKTIRGWLDQQVKILEAVVENNPKT